MAATDSLIFVTIFGFVLQFLKEWRKGGNISLSYVHRYARNSPHKPRVEHKETHEHALRLKLKFTVEDGCTYGFWLTQEGSTCNTALRVST